MTELAATAGALAHRSEMDPAVSELVARAQGGDHGAFERLYRLHVGRVFGICMRLVTDGAEAEMLTQDAFVRAWQKLGTYRGQGAFGGWLRRLTINVVIESRRKAAREARWLEPDPDAGEGDPRSRSTDESLRRRSKVAMGGVTHPRATETVIDLERAVAGLPDGARFAFVLHDVYGYRHAEIAEMAGVATGTIKAQLHRARHLLRAALRDPLEAIQ